MASVNQEPVTARPAVVQAATASASGWGNSAPLALAAFAVTTFMLSLINANVVPVGTTPVVFAVAFMFGGLAQLIAGIICLRNGNVFAGVLFGGFGAFWLSFYAIGEFFLKAVPLLQVGHSLGLFLYAFGIYATILFVASFRTSVGTVAGARAPGRHLVRPGRRELHGDLRADQDRRVDGHHPGGNRLLPGPRRTVPGGIRPGVFFRSATSPGCRVNPSGNSAARRNRQ